MKLTGFFSNYFTVRAQLVKAVKNLTPQQLDWTSLDHPASIRKLLARHRGQTFILTRMQGIEVPDV